MVAFKASCPKFIHQKRILAFFMGLLLWISPMALLAKAEMPAANSVLKGGVVITDEFENQPMVNDDDIKPIKPGSELEMTVTTELAPGMGVQTGDGFYGKVSKHFMVGNQVVIPKGSILHGTVTQMVDPKFAGRNGHVSMKFDTLITTDGREIPIQGDYTSKDNKLTAAAKVAARSAGYTLGGGLVGALLVLRVGGLAAVTASQGYALAGGAAIGGAVGLTAAMVTKGKSFMLEPGAKLKVKLGEGMALPSMSMPDVLANDVKLSGLDVKLLGIKIANDPFGERREMTLSVDIQNQTEHTFSLFDVALEDDNGALFYPSPFGDSGLWFQKLKPNSRMSGNLTFSVNNPDLDHSLVFFKQYTRQRLAKHVMSEDVIVKPVVSSAKSSHPKSGKPEKKAS
ncbi:MAG: hypothetical protein VKK59_01470 [Vampirovibrionales bacterium]|nr:hypothetical protein [Vampirovibrionales bacterium]